MPRRQRQVYLSQLRFQPADDKQRTKENPHDGCANRELVREKVEGLPPEFREVVQRRHGFNGAEETFEAIGNDSGISREAVRQRYQRAIKMLKRSLASLN